MLVLTMRTRTLVVLAVAAATAAGWFYYSRLPTASAIASLVSVRLPEQAARHSFIRLEDGKDVAFAAELTLSGSQAAKDICTDNGLSLGSPSSVPDELSRVLPKAWYGQAACYKLAQDKRGFRFIVVAPDFTALVVYVRDL